MTMSDSLPQEIGMVVAGTAAKNMRRVTDFTTFFAEVDIQDRNIVVHLFPRAGAQDQWTEGHYINRCAKCRAENPRARQNPRAPCVKCGRVGLLYVPGRTEAKSALSFPAGMHLLVKTAVDEVWPGGVAIEHVPELNCFAVQIQGAAPVKDVLDIISGFLDKVDAALEVCSGNS